MAYFIFFVRAQIISTAIGYDFHLVKRGPNNRNYRTVYKNITASSMRRFYCLVQAKFPGCFDMYTERRIDDIFTRPAGWKEKYFYMPDNRS